MLRSISNVASIWFKREAHTEFKQKAHERWAAEEGGSVYMTFFPAFQFNVLSSH